MSIEHFIKDRAQQNLKAEALTLRLSTSTIGELDDLASSLNTTRQELLAELVKDALIRALEIYDRVQNIPEPDESFDGATDGKERYFVLNTNKRHDLASHHAMVNQGLAQAFYDPWKYKIEKLKKDDVVFLYESGVGIVGIGRANGELEILDINGDAAECYQQRLLDYRKVNPLAAREIKKLIGGNMVFLQTMFKVPAAWGTVLEKALT